MKNYKEFLITSEPFSPEILSSVLWELDITGITEEVNCIKVFAEEASNVNKEEILSQLQKLVNEKMLISYEVEQYLLEDKNWNEEWEKNLNVIEVSEKIIIKPTFKNYNAKPGQVIITIDPKMSFGTGEHQTTKLILNLIEKYIKRGVTVLDVGAGTGVLAIAAVMLGAKKAFTVDIDEWCLTNAIENCELNKVRDKVVVQLGEIKDVSTNNFDMVFANIQKNVLLGIKNEIKERIAPAGILLLSGLFYSDEPDIIEQYAKMSFTHLETVRMDEWIAVVLKN